VTTELMIRTCSPDLRSYNGRFRWPDSGIVEAPDWDPLPTCGNGLHGLLWGEGDGCLLNWDSSSKWLVCEVNSEDVVDLNGKVKVPKATVVHCGDQFSATNYLLSHGGEGKDIVGIINTVGKYGTSVVGKYGKANAGDLGTAVSGSYGTSISGYLGTSYTANWGTAIAGGYGTATSGVGGTSIVGYFGTATSGYRGTATAGESGGATSGSDGTSITGIKGTSITGLRGTAAAGEDGLIQITWGKSGRIRVLVGYIGEDGLLPDVKYRVVDGKFSPATE